MTPKPQRPHSYAPPAGHGSREPRGLDWAATAGCDTGCPSSCVTARFGRMFPNLPAAYEPGDAEIATIATSMTDTTHLVADIPAGFTYFGQFVDHDITMDATGLADAERDPKATVNFRTPTFDLDSVYGSGPGVSPWLYNRDGRRLVMGDLSSGFTDAGDLPRRSDGLALIGDPRNDENLMVAQIHLVFLRFHNRVVDELEALGTPPEFVFNRAVDIVRWHYQWALLHDFVRRICRDPMGGNAILQSVIDDGNRFYQPERDPWMPIEFSVAAYRFGHSMIRESYAPFNDFFPTADLVQFFQFTGAVGDPNVEAVWRLRPVDWANFFETDPLVTPNLASRIDALLATPLHFLPGFPPGPLSDLAARNLARGRRYRLPSGQTLAHVMGVAPLTPAEVAGAHFSPADPMARHTPLWFYLLREADVRCDGRSMGPVGARILAEVFVGILRADCNSVLHQRLLRPDEEIGALSGVGDGRPIGDIVATELARHRANISQAIQMPVSSPGELPATGRRLDPALLAVSRPWTPFLPAKVPGTFTVADLVNYANHVT